MPAQVDRPALGDAEVLVVHLGPDLVKRPALGLAHHSLGNDALGRGPLVVSPGPRDGHVLPRVNIVLDVLKDVFACWMPSTKLSHTTHFCACVAP